MAKWQNDKWQIDKMTKWQNDKMTKWQNDKMTKWQNDKMTKWQNDKMTNDKMTKWHKAYDVYKKNPAKTSFMMLKNFLKHKVTFCPK